MSLRRKRVLLTLLYHGTVLLFLAVGLGAGISVGDPAVVQAFVALLVVHLLTIRRLPASEALERRVLPRHECPACGFAIELTNWWRCRCGYRGWHERHAFLPCGGCGRVFTWIECPRCQAHIPI